MEFLKIYDVFYSKLEFKNELLDFDEEILIFSFWHIDRMCLIFELINIISQTLFFVKFIIRELIYDNLLFVLF
jgi:hypothetical protein